MTIHSERLSAMRWYEAKFRSLGWIDLADNQLAKISLCKKQHAEWLQRISEIPQHSVAPNNLIR